MSTTRGTMRTPRGYLLIDIMIGGALAAIVIGGLLTVLANARARNVAAARDVVASQLVLEKIDQLRAQSFASITAGTETNVAGVTGKYTRITTVTTGSETVGGFGMSFKDVKVEVTYTTTASFDAQTRRSQATTRVYQ